MQTLEQKKENASAAMGQLLLQSWAMLAENCPFCFVPLMRSPDKTIEKCVVCERNFKIVDEEAEND